MAIVNFTFDKSKAFADAKGVHYQAGLPYWSKDGSGMVYAEGGSQRV